MGTDLKTDRYMKHESDTMTLLGTRASISSGRKTDDKGDGKSRLGTTDFPIFVECKSTGKKSFSITKDLWNDTNTKACEEGLMAPVIPVRFYKEDSMDVELDLIITDLYEYYSLYQEYKDLETRVLELIEENDELRQQVEHGS